MTLSALLRWFEDEYISGCQVYYTKQPVDLWHNEFEYMISALIAAPSFEEGNRVVGRSAKVFKRLLAEYKKAGPHFKYAAPWEGFYGRKHGLERCSIFGKSCIGCDRTTPPLKIVTDRRTNLISLKCEKCA